MKSVRLLYDVLLYGLLESVKQSVEYIFEGGQALICNPPYNFHQIAWMSNSDHDYLSLQDMSNFTKVRINLMDVKAQGNLFCSVLRQNIV